MKQYIEVFKNITPDNEFNLFSYIINGNYKVVLDCHLNLVSTELCYELSLDFIDIIKNNRVKIKKL